MCYGHKLISQHQWRRSWSCTWPWEQGSWGEPPAPGSLVYTNFTNVPRISDLLHLTATGWLSVLFYSHSSLSCPVQTHEKEVIIWNSFFLIQAIGVTVDWVSWVCFPRELRCLVLKGARSKALMPTLESGGKWPSRIASKDICNVTMYIAYRAFPT